MVKMLAAVECGGAALGVRHGQGGAAVLRCDEFVQVGEVRMTPARRRSAQRRIVAASAGGGRRRAERVVVAQAVASAYPPIARTEKTFRLPIDYYQILGAEPQYLADAVVRAFESRVNNPPQEGFSQQALLARLEILRGARDTLVDSEIRAEYNQALAEDEADTLILDVPWTKVGGALCLLNEVREAEVVLQAGQALLAQQEDLPQTLYRDVVLAMALSHVELSREAMDESPPAVVKSCSFLESALKALKEVGGRPLALDLQDQIEGTLDELSARCVLELLALPLEKEHEAQRQQGLQGLRTLLWSVDASGNGSSLGGFTRKQLMKEAFSLMTAEEQVSLFTETPESIPADSSELYAAALALVAEGFLSKTPSLIQDADALFSQLQHSIDSNPHLECAFERGICALLLGEVADCRTWLGLEDENSPFRDPSVVSYVFSFSEEGDSLPGLCKLLEGWLSEMLLPRFRDTESVQVQLTDYFDDPGVLSYLEGLEKGNGSHLAAAAAIVRIGAGAGAALKATLKKVFPVEEPLPRRDFQQFVAHRGTDGDPSFLCFQDWDSSEEEQEEESSVEERKPGFGALKIACSGLVFGALVMAGLRFLPQHQRVAHLLRSAPLVSIRGVGQREAVEEKVPQMDARLAELTVRKWQAAKAQALGATHDVAALPEALEGEMLRSWTSRASDMKRHGWFWEYALLGLTIDTITVSDNGTRATAEATLQESARLVNRNNPGHTDSYNSTYVTRYDLRRGANGWRISAGAVLRT